MEDVQMSYEPAPFSRFAKPPSASSASPKSLFRKFMGNMHQSTEEKKQKFISSYQKSPNEEAQDYFEFGKHESDLQDFQNLSTQESRNSGGSENLAQ